MAIEIFSRKEQRYLITRRKYEELVDRIGTGMPNDKNGTDGRYSITSLYFDSPENPFILKRKTN
ncbi:VTC domain-containing protein [Sporosarcina gallistercoris]|uniref:VTC domain-containing protein n=1 Tax=Sporosarcina gallistercoris TaxID=2762245 RepID=UPI003D2E2AC5